MNCLYCFKRIERYNFKSLFLKEDLLCNECRNKLKVNRKIVDLKDFKVETFYAYESLFKTLLLQYKECLDEALKEVFLYEIADYLKLRYFNYEILYVPSSQKKLNKRGFHHLKLIYESLSLKEVHGLSLKEDLIQEGKSRLERERMIDNYIYQGIKKKKVLVVDDVLTTGSSLKGVHKALRPYAQKLKFVSLSRVDR